MTESITFRELSDALSHLGFQKKTTAQFTVFRKEDRGAMIVLPPESSIIHVSPMHITAARETVVGKGIAGSQEFDQLLSSAAAKKLMAVKKIGSGPGLVAGVRSRAASRGKQPMRVQISTPAAKRAKKALHQDDKEKK